MHVALRCSIGLIVIVVIVLLVLGVIKLQAWANVAGIGTARPQ